MMPMFATSSVASALAALSMTRIADLGGEQQRADTLLCEARGQSVCAMALHQVSAAARLLVRDPKMALMLPFEFSFGIMNAFMPSYVSPKVLELTLGNYGAACHDYTPTMHAVLGIVRKCSIWCLAIATADTWHSPAVVHPFPVAFVCAAIGYFTAIIAAVACAVSHFSGKYIEATGKKWQVMVAGSCSWAATSLLFIYYTDEELATIGVLVGIYSLQGIGRGVFESCNMSVMTDFFPDDAAAAFANVVWSSGGSAALGFTVMSKQPRAVEIWAGLGISVAGCVCYLCANMMSARRPKPSGVLPLSNSRRASSEAANPLRT
jgi:MFS family permease